MEKFSAYFDILGFKEFIGNNIMKYFFLINYPIVSAQIRLQFSDMHNQAL
jgi:hypothetical protein